jgi:high-affinity Fe2+/Pb2+ permease
MSKDLKMAENEAEAAKAKLEGSFDAVKSQLLPAAIIPVTRAAGMLARRAAKKQATKIALGSAAAARRKPGTALGIAAVYAIFTFRKPIVAALKRRMKTERSDERPD